MIPSALSLRWFRLAQPPQAQPPRFDASTSSATTSSTTTFRLQDSSVAEPVEATVITPLPSTGSGSAFGG